MSRIQVHDNFTQDRPYYNELGNEIKFWNIIGTKTDNKIDMNMRTHDYIVGGGNKDFVYAGWGDDVLWGMSDPDHDWHINYESDHGVFMGEAGQDTIFVNKTAVAFGGDGNDVLVGHGSSYLRGEDDNDKFVVYTKATEVAFVGDLTHQDQMIIRFSETEGEAIAFGGIAPINSSMYGGPAMSVIDSRGDSVAEFRFGGFGSSRIDLSEFDVTVNNAGAELVITGSDYTQRVLTTGMELI
jgi:Ca2+-binding RTX toxin-like protein